MPDISALGNLQPVEPLDLANYKDNQESTFQLPVKGEYVLQAPASFPSEAFGATKGGYLSVQIDPTIVGPTNEGFQMRFIKVSAKAFDRKGEKVSQLGDYLRATGFRGVLRTTQDQANAVEATTNQVYRAKLDWSAYNGKTGLNIQGMEKFPKLADGTHQSFIDDVNDIDVETGKPKRVRARLIIDRFIAAG